MLTLEKDDIVSTEAEEWVKTLFDDICTQYNTTNSSIDWNLVREVANHFPESFLSIIEDVFPIVTSSE
jgi:hypothetical protein